jgi:hypothetical protein
MNLPDGILESIIRNRIVPLAARECTTFRVCLPCMMIRKSNFERAKELASEMLPEWSIEWEKPGTLLLNKK